MGFRIESVKEDFEAFYYVDVLRFVENLRWMFSKQPLGDKAREDLSHSYVNLHVEFIRAIAYLVGHITAVGVPVYGAYCIGRMFV